MGNKQKTTILDIQKQKLKAVFNALLDTNIAIMQFQMTLTSDKNDIKGLKSFIKDSWKAKEIINSVVHYEILVSLYNTFLNNKETYFMTLCKTVNNKKTIQKWDRTEKGFQMFLALENEAKAKSKEEYEKRVKQQEMIKQAKEQGKKIEMVLVDGKLQPRIVEEKSN